MSILEIENRIIDILSTTIELQAVYNYPIVDIGRKLPAVSVIYDGFEIRTTTFDYNEIDYKWDITLYLPIQGKSLDGEWRKLKNLIPAVINRFKGDITLDGTCLNSFFEAGEPIIQMTEPGGVVNFIGHTFIFKGRRIERWLNI